MTSCAFVNDDAGSQVFSECGYPFHLTRYWMPQPFFRLSIINLTSYTVMPSSSNSGGGLGISCPLNDAGMNRVSRASLNIG
jgi:hypothetical protein